jgi:hypothetical protein
MPHAHQSGSAHTETGSGGESLDVFVCDAAGELVRVAAPISFGAISSGGAHTIVVYIVPHAHGDVNVSCSVSGGE